MSRSLLAVLGALALAGAGTAYAAPPPMSPSGSHQQVPTSSRMEQSAMGSMTMSPDNGRCPLLYSEPGHTVFGGAGCAGGGDNAPRDHNGRLD